ncbi:hypothetical protein B0J14DRAFT_659553 [Halenospora varia]|nr:hypothetical protein B0J14DRAFT_659553 [Halenospora varia]
MSGTASSPGDQILPAPQAPAHSSDQVESPPQNLKAPAISPTNSTHIPAISSLYREGLFIFVATWNLLEVKIRTKMTRASLAFEFNKLDGMEDMLMEFNWKDFTSYQQFKAENALWRAAFCEDQILLPALPTPQPILTASANRQSASVARPGKAAQKHKQIISRDPMPAHDANCASKRQRQITKITLHQQWLSIHIQHLQ